MFKIIISALVIFAPLLINAQEIIEATVIATVNVSDVEVVEQEGSKVTVSFSLSNEDDIQSGLSYVFELYQDETLVDTHVHKEVVEIGPNETIDELLTYVAPIQLQGEYVLLLKVNNQSGFLLALSEVSEALSFENVTENRGVFIDNCVLVDTNQQSPELHSIDKKVLVLSGDVLQIACDAISQYDQDLVVVPKISVHQQNASGREVVPATTNEDWAFTIGARDTANFAIPVLVPETPQVYASKLTLVDKDGAEVSNQVIANYELYGLQASILNLSADKDFYTGGDVAEVSLLVTLGIDKLAPDSREEEVAFSDPKVSVGLSNGVTGEDCTDVVTVPVEGILQVVSMPIEVECMNPVLTATVYEIDQEITNQEITLVSSTSSKEVPKVLLLKKLIIPILTLLLIVVSFVLYLFFRARNKPNPASEYTVANDSAKPVVQDSNEDGGLPKVPTAGLFLLVLLGSLLYPVGETRAATAHYMGYTFSYSADERYNQVRAIVQVSSNSADVSDLDVTAVIINPENGSEVSDKKTLSSYLQEGVYRRFFDEPNPGSYTMYFNVTLPGNRVVAFSDRFNISQNQGGNDNDDDDEGNLRSRDLSVPNEVMVGEIFDLEARVQNSGDEDVRTGFVNEFRSIDRSGTVNVLGRLTKGPLDEGQTSVDALVGQASFDTTGNFTIKHCVDTEDVIDESRESDNCSSRDVLVKSAEPPEATISVDRDFIRPGEAVSLYWNTANTRDCSIVSSRSDSVWNDGPVMLQNRWGGLVGPLHDTQTFTLTCTSPVGFDPAVASVIVEVSPIANPQIINACEGLDIAIVADISGSVSSSEHRQMMSGLADFVKTVNTDTVFSFSTFSTTAGVKKLFSMSQNDMVNYLTNQRFSTRGNTNWEQGLLAGNSTFDPRPDRQNVILFASDGMPNTYGFPPRSTSMPSALNRAVNAANPMKDNGTAVYVIGIGAGGSNINIPNLEAISGPKAVVSSSFANVGERLTDLAVGQLCGGDAVCISPVDNAHLLSPTESEGLSVDTAWTYSEVDTAQKCEFICDSGYDWDLTTQSCVQQNSNARCIEPPGIGFAYHTGDEDDLTEDTISRYSTRNTSAACQFYCTDGFSWNGSECAVNDSEANSGSCTDLSVDRSIVRWGEEVELSWDVCGNDPATCTLQAVGGSGQTLSSATGNASFTISGITTFELVCSNGDRNQVEVRALPRVQES